MHSLDGSFWQLTKEVAVQIDQVVRNMEVIAGVRQRIGGVARHERSTRDGGLCDIMILSYPDAGAGREMVAASPTCVCVAAERSYGASRGFFGRKAWAAL